MDINGCGLFWLIATIFLAAVSFGLWVWTWDCTKRRWILNGCKWSGIGLLMAGYFAVMNITVVPCHEKDTITRLLSKEQKQWVSIPCPCGCGGHKSAN